MSQGRHPGRDRPPRCLHRERPPGELRSLSSARADSLATDSPAIPERGRALLSGGLVTGLLIAAAFAGASFLAWFALTPLLAALERRRESPRALAIQGAVCGIVLAAAGLPWLGDSAALLPGGVTGLLERALGAAPGWLVLAAAGAAFGIAAGTLFLIRAPAIAVVIAMIWAGFEAILGVCPLALSPWPGGWLALGHAIPTDYPEARIARIWGVIGGLSLAAALSSAFLHVGLRAGSRGSGWMTRFICLALALGIPFACRWVGSVAPVDAGGTPVMAAAVSAPGNDLDRMVSLVEAVSLDGSALVAVPALEGALTSEELSRTLEARAARRPGKTLPLIIARREDQEVWSGEVVLGTHRIGVVRGGSPAEMSRALRGLAGNGAEALVIIGDGSGTAAEARRQRTFDAYRAIECGRPVIRSGAGAAIHAPSGEMLAGISPPLEGSVSTEIRLSDVSTPYVLKAWRLPRLLALAAGSLVVGVGLALRLRGRRPGYRQ